MRSVQENLGGGASSPPNRSKREPERKARNYLGQTERAGWDQRVTPLPLPASAADLSVSPASLRDLISLRSRSLLPMSARRSRDAKTGQLVGFINVSAWSWHTFSSARPTTGAFDRILSLTIAGYTTKLPTQRTGDSRLACRRSSWAGSFDRRDLGGDGNYGRGVFLRPAAAW